MTPWHPRRVRLGVESALEDRAVPCSGHEDMMLTPAVTAAAVTAPTPAVAEPPADVTPAGGVQVPPPATPAATVAPPTAAAVSLLAPVAPTPADDPVPLRTAEAMPDSMVVVPPGPTSAGTCSRGPSGGDAGFNGRRPAGGDRHGRHGRLTFQARFRRSASRSISASVV